MGVSAGKKGEKMDQKTNGKLRILYVRDILAACGRRESAITMAELLSRLGSRGVTAERKSIYDDLRNLRRYGMPIKSTSRGRYSRYYCEKEE